MYKQIGNLELWWRSGSWCHPDEWVFTMDTSCPNKCLIIEMGWFGITWLRNGCHSQNDNE